MVLGLWLIVSPRLLKFAANMNTMWTHVVLGVLVTAVSVWALWDYRRNPMHMYDRRKGWSRARRLNADPSGLAMRIDAPIAQQRGLNGRACRRY